MLEESQNRGAVHIHGVNLGSARGSSEQSSGSARAPIGSVYQQSGEIGGDNGQWSHCQVLEESQNREQCTFMLSWSLIHCLVKGIQVKEQVFEVVTGRWTVLI